MSRLRVATVAAAILAVSFFTAIANAVALAVVDGRARVRETATYFTFRHLFDFAGVNLLAASPLTVHREFDLRTAAGFLHFAAATAAANAILLGLAGVLVGVALAVVATVLGKWPRMRERLDFWSPYLIASLLLSPLLAAAGNGLVHMTGRKGMRVPVERNLTVAVCFAFVVLAALALRWMLRGERRFVRAMALVAIVCAIPLVAAIPLREARSGLSDRPIAAADAPNILLISIDTLRADHVHCYGYDRETTPTLDRIGREGALFREAISPTSWTLPAHVTMLTSLPPEQHGVNTDGRRLPHGIPTLAEVLRDRGYETAGYVSAAYLDGRFGFSRGFDEYDDYTAVRLSGESARREVSAPSITRLALDYLSRRGKAVRPFFLFLHYYDVHADYVPHPPYDRMFHATTTHGLEQSIALYDGEVAWVDHHVGLVLDDLRRRGLLDRTVVVITADHGEELLDHGQTGHGKTLYDEVLRVPLFIRYPTRIAAGLTIDRQVRLMDIMPTILTLAGLRRNVPDQSARDLTPLFDAKSSGGFPDLIAFGDLRGALSSVRTPSSKYIRSELVKREELFDLIRDPHERTNLIGTSTAAPSFRADLSRWQAFCEQRRAGVDRYQLDDEQRRTLRSLGYIQ